MDSILVLLLFIITVIVLLTFIIATIRKGNLSLLIRLYLWMAFVFLNWLVPLILMYFTDPGDMGRLFILDAWTNVAAVSLSVITVNIAMAFVWGWDTLNPKMCLIYIFPAISALIIFTNPLHHLMYQNFSILKSEIVFGPYMYVQGLFDYICLIVSLGLMINFATKSDSALYKMQCLYFSTGELIPLIVSMLSTFSSNMPIYTTPLSFIPTLLLNGIAIFKLHFLDIQPLARQRILDRITDSYLVLSDQELIISFNNPFAKNFAAIFGAKENAFLREGIHGQMQEQRSVSYNLLNAIDACRESLSTISYEQALSVTAEDGSMQKHYYIVDVNALTNKGKLHGFVILFKDMTELKKSMLRLQENQQRMIEQERLAFLGQMIGGLAHNLKTPIMSISGCVNAQEALVQEIMDSLNDPDVTADDYRQICYELDDWSAKIRDASGYMSDIITAVKGQAANVSSYHEEGLFTMDELFKRIPLLMRHELQTGGCNLTLEYDSVKDYTMTGDINNMVQVLNNLVSNAIYAEKQKGGGDITITAHADQEHLRIDVRDTGDGLDPRVKSKLFKEMVTGKGKNGTGLGLYISNAVVKGKFGGMIEADNHPDGGAVFSIILPVSQMEGRV